MADDLYRLLRYSSQQEKPFIMVGSEMGALVARFYTTIYEGLVAPFICPLNGKNLRCLSVPFGD